MFLTSGQKDDPDALTDNGVPLCRDSKHPSVATEHKEL